MRILLTTHGFPPESIGGVELSVRELALGLVRRGHDVLVASGTLGRSSKPECAEMTRETAGEPGSARVAVVRIARPDLYFDHWHKSLSAAASRAFRDLLLEFRPEVVHVHHWLRLSRDLVLTAAREGIPSVVSLHDAWASCPIVFRVRPDTREACDVPVGPHPCIACAGRVPPRTPWVPTESAYMMLAERQRDIARELELARTVIVPSAAHGRALERMLGRDELSLGVEVLAPLTSQVAMPTERTTVPAAPGTLQLVSWSQIARHKGVDLLIDAFLAARAELRGEVLLELDLHGAPADPAFEAQERARTANFPVRWRGAFQASELEQAIDRRAQVFIHGTRAQESYGLTVDEAARLGLALLLPDAPVFRERCDGAAQFYTAGSAASLAREIVRLARDGAALAQAREAAAHWVRGLPSNTAILAGHERVYAKAVALGAPEVPVAAWFDERMSTQATLLWDSALARHDASALGFAPPPSNGP